VEHLSQLSDDEKFLNAAEKIGAGELHDGKRRAQRAWGSSPAGCTSARGAKPGTPEFFDRAFEYRSRYEQPWLTELIPFQEMSGKRVLEVGFGAGFDAFTFLSNGASYFGVDITPENVDRAIRHLSRFGFAPNVQPGDAENLSFASQSFDVVYSNGVLHHVPDIDKAFREVARVLRRGGEFFVILYHKNSMLYRVNLPLSALIRHRSVREQLRHIEYNEAGELPIVNVYSRAELRKLLLSTGFKPGRISVRKLVHEDLVNFPLISKMYPLIPRRLLDRLGEFVGWYVIAQATRK
jgi:ubiquinone/menaquinone biosynthesis C-methylase UbiE